MEKEEKELDIINFRSESIRTGTNNYYRSGANSYGEKPRIPSKNKRNKKVFSRIKKIAMITIIGTAAVIGLGFGVKQTGIFDDPGEKIIQIEENISDSLREQDNETSRLLSEYYNVKTATNRELEAVADETQEKIDASIEELGKEIKKMINDAGRDLVIHSEKHPNYDDDFYYDFSNISSRFQFAITEKLMQFGIPFDTAEKVWTEGLTDEQRQTIIVSSCAGKINNFKGGSDNISNFIYKVLDQDGYQDYKEDPVKFMEQADEKTIEACIQLAIGILETRELQTKVVPTHVDNFEAPRFQSKGGR